MPGPDVVFYGVVADPGEQITGFFIGGEVDVSAPAMTYVTVRSVGRLADQSCGR